MASDEAEPYIFDCILKNYFVVSVHSVYILFRFFIQIYIDKNMLWFLAIVLGLQMYFGRETMVFIEESVCMSVGL